MKNLQHQIIPNDHVDDYLNDKRPVTPLNMDYLDKELSNHPNALFRNWELLGMHWEGPLFF